MDRKKRIQAILAESTEQTEISAEPAQEKFLSGFMKGLLVSVSVLATILTIAGYNYHRGYEEGFLAAAEQPEGTQPAAWQIISTNDEKQSPFVRPANFDIEPHRKPVDIYEPLQLQDI